MSESVSRPVVCRLSKVAAPELALIERESNDPPWSEKQFAQECANDFAHVFGVRRDGLLAGFLVVHIAADEAHIVNVGVRAAMRRQGLARALLETVVRELHNRAVRWVTLEVRRTNLPAQELYLRLGFAEVGVRPRYYSNNGEDALILKLNIEQCVAGAGKSS
jgi:ribosomal-protein-alanine N-acetyltransferase